jgi:hypothetical protein
MRLSELSGYINQVLTEHGDMEVVRPLYKGIDVLTSNGPWFKTLDSEQFNHMDAVVVNENDKVIGRDKKFIISVL